MSVLARVLGLMRPHLGMMVIAILLSLVAMLANIGLMAVSGWFIAAMGLAGAAGAAMNYFTPAAIIRALAMTRSGGRYGERVLSHEATLRVLSGLRRWLYDHIEPLAPANLAQHTSGDVLARIRNDIERLEHIFLRLLSPAIVAALGALITIAVLSRYDGTAAIVVFALLGCAGVLLPYLAARGGAGPSMVVQTSSAKMKEVLVDRLDGLADLKLAGLEHDFAAHFAAIGDRQIEAEAQLARLQGISLAGVGLAANCALLAILLIVIPAVGEGRVAPPDLPLMMLLAVACFDAVAPLPFAFQSLAGTIAAARRLFDLVDTQPSVRDPAGPAPLPNSSELRFSNVSFRYASGSPLVLTGVNLLLQQGRRIAVVGETGSGKSSLVNLAMRFWDPESGVVSLGGTPIGLLSIDDVRRRISVAAQAPHLFAATIRENLLLARPDATPGHLEAATRAAQIHDFIQSLPKGYDTFVGAHGHLVSGGEARRISVARALLKEAPHLILDEPAEGLDGATADALMAGVLEAARDRGILLITHRAEGLAQMDEILVLEAGRIAHRGTFAELSRGQGPLSAFRTRLRA